MCTSVYASVSVCLCVMPYCLKCVCLCVRACASVTSVYEGQWLCGSDTCEYVLVCAT